MLMTNRLTPFRDASAGRSARRPLAGSRLEGKSASLDSGCRLLRLPEFVGRSRRGAEGAGVFLLCALLSAGPAAGAPAPASAPLRAGAATSNITPPIGALRVGGFAPYPTTHINDELHARCLVLDDGRTKLALVVCDLLGFHRSVSIEARRLIQEAVGIPPGNVMISATHTHSAGNALGTSRYENEQELDDYQRFLARRIADGVQRADNLLRPAEVAFRSVDLPEPILNRRWFWKEGKARPNPFGKIERAYKTGAPGGP